MKRKGIEKVAALALAATVLTGSASALFGLGKEESVAPEGAPAVQDLEIFTYRDTPVQGQLKATDDGEGVLAFNLEESPKKGTVELEGDLFTYTPQAGASGKDTFTYTAADEEGNRSLPATVTVRIEKTKSGVKYADTDAACATAAQYLAEEGIFVGSCLGGQYFFEPDRPVSRSEFLAMSMEAAGREVSAVTMTGFSDDASIPTWAKAYAAAGVAEGIVWGKPTEDGAAFSGEETVTLGEAATILDRVLDRGDVELSVWYEDPAAAASWAAQAVANMEALEVLEAGSFGSGAMDQALTRGDAAGMLAALHTLTQDEDNGGFFG